MEKISLAIDDIQPRSRRNSVASLFGPPRLTDATPRQNDAPRASSAPSGNDHGAEKVAPSTPAKTLRRRRQTGTQPIVESVSQNLNVKILEVIQSNWIPNDDGNQEKISLIGEITNLQSASIEDASFRWIHCERNTASINFADFEKVLNVTQVLDDREKAVASKCLKEVTMRRRTFARGKYFGPYIHQASSRSGSEIEKPPVSATFLSFPIFALMNIPDYGGDVDANSRDLRSSDQHPIRSLLQYSNILAKTTRGDERQVVTRDEVEDDGQAPNRDKPFIHVPEIWTLVINMYTIITCAPFSLDELYCDNVKVHNPPRRDQKVLVKYTDLHGRLHDFRCRTWFGLLDIISSIESHGDVMISSIESHGDVMKSLLNDPESQYKLIDPGFRPIDNTRWLEIVEATGARSVNVRGVKLLEDSALSLDFAERKLRASTQGTFVLLGISLSLSRLRERATRFQVEKAERAKQDQVKKRIAHLSNEVRKIKRSRHFNRFLLYAARSQILDPHASDVFKQTEAQIPIGRTNRSTTGSTIAEDPSDQQKKNSNPLESTAIVSHLPEVYQNDLKIPAIKVDTQEDEQTRMGAPEIQLTIPRITLNDEDMNQSPKPLAALVLPRLVAASEKSMPTLKKSQSYQSILTNDLEAKRSPVDAFEDLESQRMSRLPSVLPLQKLSSHAESSLGLAGPSIVDPLAADSLGQGVQDMSHLTSLPHIASENSLSQGIRRPTRRWTSLQDADSIYSRVFPASPPRLPWRAGGGSTILRSGRNALSSSSTKSESDEHPSSEESPNVSPSQQQPKKSSAEVPVTISEKVQSRSAFISRSCLPFFEWHTQGVRRTDMSSRLGETVSTSFDKTLGDASPFASSSHRGAEGILSSIETEIREGSYYVPTVFAVNATNLADVPLKKEADVIKFLESERDRILRFSHPEEEHERKAHEILLEQKQQLFLSSCGVLRCFVSSERGSLGIIGKFWGILHLICCIQLKKAGALPYPLKHDTILIQYAARQFERIEQKCNQLLLDSRPEPIDGESSPNWRLPSALARTFRDIVLFLLSTYLAVNDHRVDSTSVHHIGDKVLDHLAESESALLRISEHAEMELDQIGHESIRTADTILEILVENAMSFSTKKELDKKGRPRLPFFDIVNIYSNYTSNCIIRAKRDASARVYEDVRLLREEVETISLMLKHQQILFREVLKARGSTPETLDKRLTQRIQSSLDEMIRHFATLSDYAVQAEFWNETRNSIEVKGEDNSKAIYVFTAVTVIFLPLTFIAGLLGMNTVDIRNAKDSQWLFWAVALPFTFTVLIICLCIAKHNFGLRKLVRSILRKSGFLRRSRKGLGVLGRSLLPKKWYKRGRRRAADWIDSGRDVA